MLLQIFSKLLCFKSQTPTSYSLTQSSLKLKFRNHKPIEIPWNEVQQIEFENKLFAFTKITFKEICFFLGQNQSKELNKNLKKLRHTKLQEQKELEEKKRREDNKKQQEIAQKIIEVVPPAHKKIRSIIAKSETEYLKTSYLKEEKPWLDAWFKSTPQIVEIPKDAYLDPETASLFKSLKTFIENFDQQIEYLRQKFIEKELLEYKDYFDTVESKPLTKAQRKACVVNDDRNLVLAGAGTGKTSVMVAKTGYLIKKGLAKPTEIILVAFNKSVRQEMQARIKDKIGEDVSCFTFHSLGKFINQNVMGRNYCVHKFARSDTERLHFLQHQFEKELSKEIYRNQVFKFFSEYTVAEKSMFDFNSKKEYDQFISLRNYQTLSGEEVRSLEEVKIANFFYINGINYIYEAPHPQNTSYTPDFYLPDANVYLEHFGIDRNNQTAPFVPNKEYLEGMEWKREFFLSEEVQGTLEETFHYDFTEGVIEEKLEGILQKFNLVKQPRPVDELIKKLNAFGRHNGLVGLIDKLITNLKSTCLSFEHAFEIAASKPHPERTKAALELARPLFDSYQMELNRNSEIDFNDMICPAREHVKNGLFQPTWKYILVDEFQDISKPRAELVKFLCDNSSNSVLACVGDDWQSIYRFAGSDIGFTTRFKDFFGSEKSLLLDKTFRFDDSILRVSSDFVMRNTEQKTKNISSFWGTPETPSISMVERMKVTFSDDDIREVLDYLEVIAKNSGEIKSVMLLGRYNDSFVKTVENFTDSKKYVESVIKHNYPNLCIHFSSVHKSKGTEADYVIVYGLNKPPYMSFPSNFPLETILEAFAPDDELFPYAEERRLFYVALTRAKKKTFLVYDPRTESPFITELKEGEYQLEWNDFPKDPNLEYIDELTCPYCSKAPIVLRLSKKKRNIYSACADQCSESKDKYVGGKCRSCSKGLLVTDNNGRYKCLSCGQLHTKNVSYGKTYYNLVQ